MVKRIYFFCVLLFLFGVGHIKAQEMGYLTVKEDLTITQNEQELENIILEQNKEISDNLLFYDEAITISPNPNNGCFEISLPFMSEEIDRIQIINQTAQIVFEKSSHTGTEINIPNPIPGMYFVSVVSKGKVFIQKIIIK